MGAIDDRWYRGKDEGVTVYRNDWFQIRSRDGYFSLEYGVPQVAVLVLVGESVLLIKVQRPLIDDEPWELPAGGAHHGEERVAAARRELHEETGIYIAELDRFELLPMISEMPNRTPELLTTYQVRITPEEYEAREEHHEKEITGMTLMSPAAIKEAIVSGAFYLGAPIGILARYLFMLEREASTRGDQ